MRNLSGSHNYDPAIFHVCTGNRILNVAVLHDRGFITAFYNCFGFLQPFFHISDKVIGTDKYIILFVEMDWRFASIHGFTRMDFYRIFFIFNFDQAQCPLGCDFIFCHYSSNIISVITDSSGKDIAVCNILMCQFHRPGMSRRRITMIRYVFKSNHFYYAVQSLCFTGID